MNTLAKKIIPFAAATHLAASLALSHVAEDDLHLQDNLLAQPEPTTPEQLSQLQLEGGNIWGCDTSCKIAKLSEEFDEKL